MKYSTLHWALSVLILILLGFCVYLWERPTKPQTTADYREDSIRHAQQLAKRDLSIARLQARADSAIQVKDSIIKRREITIRGLSLRRAPIPVIIAADSLEFTQAQLENRDSTIDEQFGVIGDLKAKIAITNNAEHEEDSIQDLKLQDWQKYSLILAHQRDSVSEVAQKAQKKADKNLMIGPSFGAGLSPDGKVVPQIGFTATYPLIRLRIGRRK